MYINGGFLEVYLMHCQPVLGYINYAKDLRRIDVIMTEQHPELLNFNFLAIVLSEEKYKYFVAIFFLHINRV